MVTQTSPNNSCCCSPKGVCNFRGSRVAGRGSRVAGRGSRVNFLKTKIIHDGAVDSLMTVYSLTGVVLDERFTRNYR